MDFQNYKNQFLLQAQSALSLRPFFKYLLCIQLCGFLLSLISPISDLLVLTPSDLFHLHLWRVVSNLFVENNLFVIAWTSYCFYQFLVYIQPNWPLEEIAKYAIIVQLGTVSSLVISTLLLYIFTGVVFPFYYAQIYGTSALAMASLLALKQFIPDTVLLTTPVGRLKNGHLPMASIGATIPLWIVGLLRGILPFQLIFSAQISWTYLRFFQSRGGIGESMVGDRSEHFSWASLFPRRLQPVATLLGRLTFRCLNQLGILKRVMRREHLDFMEEQTLQMEALESVKVATPGAAVLAPESWDVERKRQKALRMLNERLAAQSGAKRAQTPQSLGNQEPYTMPMMEQFSPPPPATEQAQSDSEEQQFYQPDEQRLSIDADGEERINK